MNLDLPVPGLYRMRAERKGRWLAVEIRDVTWRDEDTGELMEDQRWEATRDGEAVAVERVWPWAARHPIDAAEYQRLLANAFVNPDASSDPMRSPIPTFAQRRSE